MQLNRESVFEVKDRESLRKALMEAEVVEKKCYHYATIAKDNQVKGLFESTAKDVGRAMERLRKLSTKYM